jgi:hypothetical protein
MAVKKLTPAQKEAIITVYNAKTRTIKQIAEFLGVSSRTVSRVLEEKGIAGPMAVRSGQAAQLMALLHKRGINPADMEKILDTPALTPANVAFFLRDCNQEQLKIILRGAGLIAPLDWSKMPNVQQRSTQPIPKNAQQKLPLHSCPTDRASFNDWKHA